MPVQYKFRGEKAFRSLLNVTTPCTLQRVKTAIFEQARIDDQQTDLVLDDSQRGSALDPKALLVQDALVQVIVRRTPLHRSAGASASLVSSSLSTLAVVSDVVPEAVRQEEDAAIDRTVEQHDVGGMGLQSAPSGLLLRYSRSHRLAVGSRERQRSGYIDSEGEDEEDIREPPPANYTCHRCGQVGGQPESHWIYECPTNEDPDHMKKVRTAKGVPRDFLKKFDSVEEAQEHSAGGVTFTLPGHSGHYIIAHEASYTDRKLRVGDTVQEKVVTAFTEGAKRVESSLKCPLCNQTFRNAILAPCCGATFCSDCVIDRLSHSSTESRCPGCRKEVYAHQLIPNEQIRNQVEQVARASRADAVAKEKEKEKQALPKAFEVPDSLKHRVNHRQKHSGDDSAPLALTNNAFDQTALASWSPLGFGPMLSFQQFSEWQRLASGSLPSQAKEPFEDWQNRMREAHLPAMPVVETPALPSHLPDPANTDVLLSKEGFEEMQRIMRESKLRGQAQAAPVEQKDHRREHKDKKEKKEKRVRSEVGDDARQHKRTRA